jgi:2-methylcitrate dehydratase
MTQVEQIAEFVNRASFENLSKQARQQLKIRILDALGCAIGALDYEPLRVIKEQIKEFDCAGSCSLIGGGRTAPDRAAFYNSALVRYLDFNDAYLAKGETCHPSDNLGAVLAAGEYANCSGRDLLTALAVAYQVQCRLSEVAPVRARGFDHTTQGSFALAAGVSKVLGLDPAKTANALAIAGTAYNALRVTRTGALSNWKGLAYPNTAFGVVHAAFLAKRGITGPGKVFEGNKGFMDTISGRFEHDWSMEDLEMVTRTIVKKYNAEIHSQSAIEGILELNDVIDSSNIQSIDIEIFDVAYHIIGGGEEGEKIMVRTKEEADHSLPYIIAAAILDNQVTPAQYLPERIRRWDVQALLRKIHIRPVEAFSDCFPGEMPTRITLRFNNGLVLTKEKMDFEGFITRPMHWETVVRKFEQLSQNHLDTSHQADIVEAVLHLEGLQVHELASLLEKIK